MSFGREADNLDHLLEHFLTVGLQELEESVLLSRFDLKFLLQQAELECFLSQLPADYRLLEVAGSRLIPYETVYFDTDNFMLYRQHHNGLAGRYKLRYRRYVNTDLTFFEIKKKNNKQLTEKYRLPCREMHIPLSPEILNFLRSHGCVERVQQAAGIYYNRMTLVHKQLPERITIDTNLHVKAGAEELRLPGLAIVEVKQASHIRSTAMAALAGMRLRQCRISKYCLAVSSLIPDQRHNNFKPLHRTLEKLLHEV